MRAGLDVAIEAASLADLDAGAVAAARALADKIDAWDQIVQWAIEDASESGAARPKVPDNDNTALPTFLRYLDALGLTPAARKDASPKGASGGKLGELRSIVGGAARA